MLGGFSQAQSLITAMISPALLIGASASLIATTLMRLARVIDRVRKLSERPEHIVEHHELRRFERRAMLAEGALRCYFVAVVCFVLSSFAVAADHMSGNQLSWLPVVVTIGGMCMIVAGSALMLRECRLATDQIQHEIAALRSSKAP